MDRERLTRLLEEPGRVAQGDIAGLRAMAERYPWFGGAQLLLTLGEHATGDVLFDERLRVAAAHVPMRAVLFDGIHPGPDQGASAKLTVVKDEDPPLLKVRKEPEAPVEVPMRTIHAPAPTPVPLRKEAPALPEELTPDIVPEAEPLESEAAVEAPDAPVPTPPPAPSPTRAMMADALDLQIRQAARAGSYDVLGSVEALPQPVPHVAPTPAPAPIAEFRPAVVADSTPAPSPMPTRLRFTAWLDQAPHSGEEAAVMAPIPAVAQLADPIRTPAEVDAEDQALIDKFIQLSAPAPARKTAFFTPQQAAKRSLEDDGIVSETLARIHAKQGNITKAIETYQRLALKHPEKSAYFAALSKALEGGSNK